MVLRISTILSSLRKPLSWRAFLGYGLEWRRMLLNSWADHAFPTFTSITLSKLRPIPTLTSTRCLTRWSTHHWLTWRHYAWHAACVVVLAVWTNSEYETMNRHLFAEITPHGILAENGVNFELLGSAPAWGLDEQYTYAVREAGSIKGNVLPAVTRGWPYRESEIEIILSLD